MNTLPRLNRKTLSRLGLRVFIPDEKHYPNWDGVPGISRSSVFSTGWLEPAYEPRFRHRAPRWRPASRP